MFVWTLSDMIKLLISLNLSWHYLDELYLWTQMLQLQLLHTCFCLMHLPSVAHLNASLFAAVVVEQDSAAAQQYSRQGCPTGLRADLWALILNSTNQPQVLYAHTNTLHIWVARCSHAHTAAVIPKLQFFSSSSFQLMFGCVFVSVENSKCTFHFVSIGFIVHSKNQHIGPQLTYNLHNTYIICMSAPLLFILAHCVYKC